MARKSRRDDDISVLEEASNIISSDEKIPTAIYARLSIENNGRDDTESLDSQIMLLKSYVKSHPEFELKKCYVDNGFSGTTFDRPQFLDLINDASCGEISCIIVKDLSRFGRNYIESGVYIETILPKLNVRLIAINDRFDSSNPNDRNSLSVPIKNMINEMYSHDQSRKVIVANKIRANKPDVLPLGIAPYGYRKNKDKSQYIPDEELADYVKIMFLWRSIGIGNIEIFNRLSLLNAPLPRKKRSSNSSKWSFSSVGRIFKQRVYLGDVCFGTMTDRLGNNGRTRKIIPKEEWIVHEGVHEPLATIYDFGMSSVSSNKAKRTVEKNDLLGCFRNKLYCKSCGRPLCADVIDRYSSRNPASKYTRFICRPKPFYDKACYSYISEDYLKVVVMENINHQIRLMTDRAKMLIKVSSLEDGRNYKFIMDCKIRSLESTLSDLKENQMKLYEDYKTGIISKEDYDVISSRNSNKIKAFEERIVEHVRQREKFSNSVNRYLSMIGELEPSLDNNGFDPELVNKLVSKIEVTNDKRIEITFKTNDLYLSIEKLLEGVSA